MNKERPILMNPDSVRGLRDNRKRQTRRVMKDPPGGDPRDDGHASSVLERCPHGQIGDRLWVKEAFRHFGNTLHAGRWTASLEYQAGGSATVDFGETQPPRRAWWNSGKKPWTPSLLMPRWASRFLLEITQVRFQPLHQISFEDCLEEGILSTSFWGSGSLAPSADDLASLDQERPGGFPLEHDDPIEQGWVDYARLVYSRLWDSLNAQRGLAWASNPWVWVIGFKEVEMPASQPGLCRVEPEPREAI